MREIDLGSDCGGAVPRDSAALSSRTRVALKVRANLFRLVRFQRTGMGLPRAHSELRQYVKNLSALDFQLARKIVDSNLTHPPLFKSCRQNP